MKTLKITLITLAASTAIFVQTGCKPTETTTPDPPSNCIFQNIKEGANDVQKVDYNGSYHVTKLYTFDAGAAAGTYEYTYNTAEKVDKIVSRDAANVSTGFVTYEYNANGAPMIMKTYDAAGILANRKEYQYYSTSGRLSQTNDYVLVTGFADLKLFSRNIYIYTADGTSPSTIEVTFYRGNSGNSPTKYKYTYDSNSNTVKDSSFYSNNNVARVTARTFDTKKSAVILFAGIAPYSLTGTVTPNSIAGKNNVMSEITEIFPFAGGGATTTTQTNYAYEANSNNFTTKQTVSPTAGSVKTYDINYNCR